MTVTGKVEVLVSMLIKVDCLFRTNLQWVSMVPAGTTAIFYVININQKC